MQLRWAVVYLWTMAAAPGLFAQSAVTESSESRPAQQRPHAGPVQIMPASELKPGMKGTAWTVFQGTEPEPVPVEIIGLWKNAWGPRQDVILGKMGGKAARTNVAGGMSGSPVYIDGKLIGAVALRISVFSPDAICGITPIEHMLEINELDASQPSSPKAPQTVPTRAALEVPAGLMNGGQQMIPIETPLSFAGFHEGTLRAFQPYFQQMGVTAVQGGAAGDIPSSDPAPGWQKSLQPGEAIAGVLVSGDLSITGLGTVTYNDGKRVLGFGHSFFNLGPVNMPMSKGEVLMVLSSAFQPNKFANATEIVGALRQDRHSGIMGVLGNKAETIPVHLTVKTPGQEKKFNFNVFVNQKWTPFLMMMTVFNTLQDLNDAAGDEATYRLNGHIELNGERPLDVSNMVASGEGPMPAPMQLSAWWADRFNRMFQNGDSNPDFKSVSATVEMIPARKTLNIETAWLESTDVERGGELTGKILLQPWRGASTVRDFKLKIPAGLPPGEHRLLICDNDVMNRSQALAAAAGKPLDLAQTLSLMRQERTNTQLYVSVVEARPTLYDEDRTLAGIPPSVMNVLQSERSAHRLSATLETARTALVLPFDEIVNGSTTLRFKVR